MFTGYLYLISDDFHSVPSVLSMVKKTIISLLYGEYILKRTQLAKVAMGDSISRESLVTRIRDSKYWRNS